MADPQKGIWLLPSRRRPVQLHRFCEAVVTANTSTPGVILIHHKEYQDPGLVAAYGQLPLPPNWQIVKTVGDSQGDKLREVEHLYRDGDWLGLIGDDQVVCTKEWDLKLIERLLGWNLVSCADDDWQLYQRGGRIAGTMVWSGDLYRVVGYIFPGNMHHGYLDDIWEQLGAETGCWSFERDVRMDVLIEHHHYTRGMSQKDETYALAYDRYMQEDYQPFGHWMANEKPHAAERIRELMREYQVPYKC